MKRYEQEKQRNKTEAKRLKTYSCGPEIPAGKLRKKKGLDCGKPKCQLCHSDKYPKRKKTRKELDYECD